jgi:uncharacterized protein YkwD
VTVVRDVEESKVPTLAARLVRVAVVFAASVGLALVFGVLYGRVAAPERELLPPDEQQLVDRINDIRAEMSCPLLTVDADLVAAAQAQADDMVARSYVGSVNPDNEDPSVRARAFGYPGRATESYAAGLGTPAEVIAQWTNTENPDAARVIRRIENCALSSIGVGHNTGNSVPGLAAHVWVVSMGDL